MLDEIAEVGLFSQMELGKDVHITMVGNDKAKQVFHLFYVVGTTATFLGKYRKFMLEMLIGGEMRGVKPFTSDDALLPWAREYCAWMAYLWPVVALYHEKHPTVEVFISSPIAQALESASEWCRQALNVWETVHGCPASANDWQPRGCQMVEGQPDEFLEAPEPPDEWQEVKMNPTRMAYELVDEISGHSEWLPLVDTKD